MVEVFPAQCLFCVVHEYTTWMLLLCIIHTACRLYSEYHTGFTSHFGGSKIKVDPAPFLVGWYQTTSKQVLRDQHESSHVFFDLNASFWALASKSRADGCWVFLSCSPLCLRAGANPSRPGGFPGANSPGPVADLYGPSSQDSAVGNYISAASPQPGSGFGPSITVSPRMQTACRVWPHLELGRLPRVRGPPLK